VILGVRKRRGERKKRVGELKKNGLDRKEEEGDSIETRAARKREGTVMKDRSPRESRNERKGERANGPQTRRDD